MTHIAKLGLSALRLAIQAAVGIALAGVRFIAAPWAWKSGPSLFSKPYFGLKLLNEAHASISVPSTKNVHPTRAASRADDSSQRLREPLEHIAILQPLLVHGECGGNKNRRIRSKTTSRYRQQRAGAVLARIVRVPDRDEPGNLFVLRDAGQENLINNGAEAVGHGCYAIVRRAPAV